MGSFYMNDVVEPQRKRYIGTAGTNLKKGEAVCYKISATETTGSESYAAREYQVEDPSITNFEAFAGVLAADATVLDTGEVEIEIIPAYAVNCPGIVVRTDHNVVAGDLLGIQPSSRLLRRGCLFGQPVLRAYESQDRSTTTGLVKGTFMPVVTDREWKRKHTVIEEDMALVSISPDTALTAIWTAASSGGAVTQDATQLLLRQKGDWNLINGTSGTAALAEADGGQLVLTSTATTNNAACLLYLASAAFKVATNRPILMDVLCTPTEHNTDDANFFIGFADSSLSLSATVPLADDGAGPPSDYDGANFFKVDGGTVWQAETSNSTSSGTQSTDTDCGTLTTATQYRLRILLSRTYCYFWINDTLVHSNTTAGSLPLADSLLHFIAAVKAGSNTGTPNLGLERVAIYQHK